ncbi:hypothetical protein ACTOJ1_000277 [Shigella flexneri]
MKDILITNISKENKKEFIDAIKMASTGHLISTSLSQYNAIEALKRLNKLDIKK